MDKIAQHAETCHLLFHKYIPSNLGLFLFMIAWLIDLYHLLYRLLLHTKNKGSFIGN